MEKILALSLILLLLLPLGKFYLRSFFKHRSHGCINVHASLLPELRGGAPIHYAILKGKKKTGITIMYMAEKLDAGDILTQVEVPITEEDNVGTSAYQTKCCRS